MRAILICGLAAGFASLAVCQEFEVVSIKPNNSMSGSSSTHTDKGMLRGTNLSLRSLIVRAYGLRNYQVEGPDWLESEHFDIAAKFPDGPLPKDPAEQNAAYMAMMQKMLADRFHVATHRSQKTFAVYGLVVAKGGIKFKPVPDGGSHSSDNNNTHYKGTGIPMESFAGFLSRRPELPADLPVLDMTGLKGDYEMTLDWVREAKPSPDAPASTDLSAGPSLLSALEDQLGLKLETRKAPIEILIVDHAEKVPTDN